MLNDEGQLRWKKKKQCEREAVNGFYLMSEKGGNVGKVRIG